ncbi:MAG: hypothetical protein GX096_00720 [Clostridiales bacterium]|nr:hypothetical protein [Clostridiales bacterium]
MSNQNQPDKHVLQNLTDAGCDELAVQRYCHFECCAENQQSDRKAQIKILREHRKCLLESLRTVQRELECLDYLIYKLKNEPDTEK